MEEYVKASKDLLEEKKEKPLAFAMEARRDPHARAGAADCSGGKRFGRTACARSGSAISPVRGCRLKSRCANSRPRAGRPRPMAAHTLGAPRARACRLPSSAARVTAGFLFADRSGRRTTASPSGRGCRSWTRYQRGRARGAIARRPSPRRTARVHPWTEWIFSVTRTSRSRATRRNARARTHPVARGPYNGVGASLHPVESV